MNPQITDALNKLSSLNLQDDPREEAERLIKELGKYACIRVNFHKGKVLMRARPNEPQEVFHSKCQLTYKPQQFNTTYQRASTPNMTMFYATAIPEVLEPGELDNLRVIGIFEALPWLRDKTKKGIQKLTFSKWIVKKDIQLLAVVQHQDYYNKSSYTRQLVDDFNKFKDMYPELAEETAAISDFFAKEFAKEIINNHNDYLLSALYTELAVRLGYDGVFYPSVRTQGQGFNIAITPECADNNLDLVVAGECTIYKRFGDIVLDNDTVVELKSNQTNFTFSAVDPRYHGGTQQCLDQLGIKSINELLD